LAAVSVVSVDGVVSSWDEIGARAQAISGQVVGARAVALCATSSMDTVVGVLAGLAAGVPVVPIPPDAGPVERAHILRDCGADAFLGDSPWDDAELQGLQRVGLDHTGEGSSLPASSADATALIMYTSGTTGLPKGAILSHRAIAADLDGLAAAWAWMPDDHVVHGLPLFHVHGLILGVLGARHVGCRLTHTGRPLPERYAAAAGSLYFGVPTVWSRVANDATSAAALAGARLLVSGSAPLPTSVFDQLAARTGHRPVERYGMTESLITLSTRADGERRPGSVGLPIAGVETRLAADDGAAVADDGETIGGLQVRGTTMFDGYVSADAGWTDDGWFVTGDAATIGPDGFHCIAGRTSVDIIKTGGFKVGAGEVEAAFLDHPAVSEVAVVGRADDDLGQRVVAYVVVDAAGAGGIEPTLAAFVAERLTTHKRPRDIVVLDELPRNAMGKVLKTQLMR
jgi:fatty acid CoA ligase FadD36